MSINPHFFYDVYGQKTSEYFFNKNTAKIKFFLFKFVDKFNFLKKYISLLFISLYLFGYTNFGEVSKIGLLVEHFQEHSSESSIGFIDFLKMHYSLQNKKDSDFNKDMSLPFKSLDSNSFSVHSGYFLPEKPVYFFEQVSAFSEKIKVVRYKNTFFPLAQTKNLFQPPDYL